MTRQRLATLGQISIIFSVFLLISSAYTYFLLDFYKGTDFSFSGQVKEKENFLSGGNRIYVIVLDKEHKLSVGKTQYDSFKIDQQIKVGMRLGYWSGKVYIVSVQLVVDMGDIKQHF